MFLLGPPGPPASPPEPRRAAPIPTPAPQPPPAIAPAPAPAVSQPVQPQVHNRYGIKATIPRKKGISAPFHTMLFHCYTCLY